MTAKPTGMDVFIDGSSQSDGYLSRATGCSAKSGPAVSLETAKKTGEAAIAEVWRRMPERSDVSAERQHVGEIYLIERQAIELRRRRWAEASGNPPEVLAHYQRPRPDSAATRGEKGFIARPVTSFPSPRSWIKPSVTAITAADVRQYRLSHALPIGSRRRIDGRQSGSPAMGA